MLPFDIQVIVLDAVLRRSEHDEFRRTPSHYKPRLGMSFLLVPVRADPQSTLDLLTLSKAHCAALEPFAYRDIDFKLFGGRQAKLHTVLRRRPELGKHIEVLDMWEPPHEYVQPLSSKAQEELRFILSVCEPIRLTVRLRNCSITPFLDVRTTRIRALHIFMMDTEPRPERWHIEWNRWTEIMAKCPGLQRFHLSRKNAGVELGQLANYLQITPAPNGQDIRQVRLVYSSERHMVVKSVRPFTLLKGVCIQKQMQLEICDEEDWFQERTGIIVVPGNRTSM